jgi:ectoine hydroxylase-related dioxygenase (phytanoyl-CoA dioxygenase family)
VITLNCRTQPAWKAHAAEAVRNEGFCVVEDVLGDAFLAATRTAMYGVQACIRREIGEERLRLAGELGVLRLMLKHDAHFLRFLEIPQVLEVVDAMLSDTAILHLQNGFILPSFDAGAATPRVFQNTFHRDFPRHLNGYVASINVFFAIDPFRPENGATWVVPGSHHRAEVPTPDYCKAHGVPATCRAGSMIVFDSTLWHAAGENTSGEDRLAINHQFTRSFIKQQIDYVRAIGAENVAGLAARTQQLLGYYTRVVTSLDEYYRPESERLYRRGQG